MSPLVQAGHAGQYRRGTRETGGAEQHPGEDEKKHRQQPRGNGGHAIPRPGPKMVYRQSRICRSFTVDQKGLTINPLSTLLATLGLQSRL